MAHTESLGIVKLESAHWYVTSLNRARDFYTKWLDFSEIGESNEEFSTRMQQKSAVFVADNVQLICSEPLSPQSRAGRWLEKHPEGVGTLTFQVEDIDLTWKLLEKRGGTMLDDIHRFTDDKGGKLATFSITTPFGNTTFRFVQRDGFSALFPGMTVYPTPRGGKNRFGFKGVDHITSNFRTLKPMELWMKHVMGMEEFWSIEFHTSDEIERGNQHGSGLKSIVLWDPKSQVKFANNEPSRPNFRLSQINTFVEHHRDNGIQHLALEVGNIVESVRAMRQVPGLEFLGTPGAYYDYMPERIAKTGINVIDEKVEDLRELGILLDGGKHHSYLLQIFMKEKGHLLNDVKAGPFFYEVIQRKGDRGFGGGNFRALFESIERAQNEAASRGKHV